MPSPKSPGTILRDYMHDEGMTLEALSFRCGLSELVLTGILGDKAPLNKEQAMALWDATGLDYGVWARAEVEYRESRRRKSKGV